MRAAQSHRPDSTPRAADIISTVCGMYRWRTARWVFVKFIFIVVIVVIADMKCVVSILIM